MMKKILLLLAVLVLFPAGQGSAAPYDYPFTNPFEATVIGTPGLYTTALPKEVKIKKLSMTVFEERKVPEVFWYHDKFRFSFAKQKERAPLIFLIAGTGASHHSSKMRLMQNAFWNAGFHVISLSSPTHPNFIVTASSSMVPGDMASDALDLYRVMEMAWQQVKGRMEVDGFHLAGYSLGGAQAAFVSKLDEERQSFNFKRVLMINPPVNLFNSVSILDRMLEENVPGGIEHVDAFMGKVFDRFSEIYGTMDRLDFSDDFLYRAYKKFPPKEDALAALIGITFRMSAANMIFTADVMSEAGLVVPKGTVLSSSDSLTDYFIVTHRIGFMDYFNELLYPHFSAMEPGLTREALLHRASLESIEGYLTKTEKIGLLTNDDDIILDEGEADFFRRVFKDRATLYPNGGHCGNMGHSENIANMIQFFKE